MVRIHGSPAKIQVRRVDQTGRKFLEADEAKTFGLIDEVFDTRPGQGEVTPA